MIVDTSFVLDIIDDIDAAVELWIINGCFHEHHPHRATDEIAAEGVAQVLGSATVVPAGDAAVIDRRPVEDIFDEVPEEFPDQELRDGELVQVDIEMLREGQSELSLPAHIQKDYPNDNSPTAVTMELGSGTPRTLNSYLASRWKDTEALFPSRKADRITEQGVRYMLHEVAEAADVQPWKVNGSRMRAM
jgi:hypothetical protein